MNFLDARNPHYKRDPRNYESPYAFSEYPKWVTLPDGSGVTVHNELEEAAARGQLDDNNDPQLSGDGEPPQGESSPAEPVAGMTALGVAIRKAGRPSKAELAARAAAEAAAQADGNVS